MHAAMQGESRADLHTLPSASRLDNIRALHGAELAAALLPLQLRVGRDVEGNVPMKAEMSFALEVGTGLAMGVPIDSQLHKIVCLHAHHVCTRPHALHHVLGLTL